MMDYPTIAWLMMAHTANCISLAYWLSEDSKVTREIRFYFNIIQATGCLIIFITHLVNSVEYIQEQLNLPEEKKDEDK